MFNASPAILWVVSAIIPVVATTEGLSVAKAGRATLERVPAVIASNFRRLSGISAYLAANCHFYMRLILNKVNKIANNSQVQVERPTRLVKKEPLSHGQLGQSVTRSFC